MKAIRFFTIILLLIGFTQSLFSQSSDKLEVRLGIMHSDGESVHRLKAQDKVFSGDKIRIFVESLSDCHVYVVYSDGDESTLLFPESPNDTAENGTLLILPAEDEFYELTAENPEIKFSFISSKDPVTKIADFFNDGETKKCADWIALEETLSNSISTDLGDITDQPFSIAAIVRGDKDMNEKFLKKLQTFRGDHSVFRSYTVRVLK